MAERCQVLSGLLNKTQCPNPGEQHTTRPRDDAPVFWMWLCPEHAKDLPGWKWKRPEEWTQNG